MTLASQFSEAANPTLQGRIQMATASAAQAIASEADTTPNHANRLNLATQVARSPQGYTQPFTNLLCAEGITSQSADADIENMVSAVWDTMAGKA